jgi:hypothetical protein
LTQNEKPHIFYLSLSATISNILTNNMMRSVFFALFALVLASMLDQTQALASIVRSVRRSGMWGKLTGQPRGGFPQVPATQATQVIESNLLPQVTTLDSAGFDADAYRREMIDLVYERSMQRFS